MGGAIMRDVHREIGSLCAVENWDGSEQMGVVIDLDPLQVLYMGDDPWDVVKVSIGTLPVESFVFTSDEYFNDYFGLDGTEPVWDVIKAVREVATYFTEPVWDVIKAVREVARYFSKK